MNERILELAEQATKTYTSYFDGRGNVSETYFDKEKFAELIVEQCINVLMSPKSVMNKVVDLSPYNDGWVNGRLLGIEHIKEHFGIK